MISDILIFYFIANLRNILLEFGKSIGLMVRESLVSFDCFCDSTLRWQIVLDSFRLICREIFSLRPSSNCDILKGKNI